MRIIFISLLLLFSKNIFSQGCCSGGSGSPIAGGGSQGVLGPQQMELASSYQYIFSNKFLAKDHDTVPLFDHFFSNYIYSKIGYGITKDLTFSVEMGYYRNKTQIGKRDSITGIPIDSFSSRGVADLILFPKYDVYNHSDSAKKVELALGMGYKIPLGKYNDSAVVFHNPFTGKDIYGIMPPIVQPTNGSQDFIFYAMFLRGFPKHNFRLFTNATYIRKGWNPLGYKFGDYAGVGIFAGKTFFKKLGVTLQLKGEWIDSMRYNKEFDKWGSKVLGPGFSYMQSIYNIYTNSTGSKKVSLVPQLSYNWKNITVYALKDFPLYEFVNGVQMRTQTFFTAGLSYRFFTTKNPVCAPSDNGDVYECPMKCEGLKYGASGKCKVCRMDLQKTK
ncbi:MAG: hypothetical protein HY063_15425 [Bacteroidetes bacterium]|nr:hypothetical protein [Bacteroidota bacterium]